MRHCPRRPKHQHDCSCDGNCIIALPTVVIVKRCIIRVANILVSVPIVVVSLQLPIIRNHKYFVNQRLTVRYHSSPFQYNGDWPKQQPPHQQPHTDGNKDDQIDFDDDPLNDTQPTDLNHFVKEQMKKSQHNSFATNDVPDYYNHKQQQRYDPLMGYTLEDLESFASSSSSSLNRPKFPKYGTEELHTTTNADGVYLDTNEYIQSSQTDYNIDIDGTIPFTGNEDIGATTATTETSWTTSILPKKSDARYKEAMQRYVESIVSEPIMNSVSSDIDDHTYNIREPTTTSSTINNIMNYYQPQPLPVDNPDSSYQRYDPIGASRNTNNDMEDMALDELWTTITQVQAQQRQHDPAVSEEIHRQIFANEVGFYNQSQLFLESLTNTTMAGKANVERRGRFFRTRQEQAIQSLQQQIEEFEALLLSQQQMNATNDDVLCTQCQCRLSDDEINNPASIGGNNKERICRVCYMEQLVASSKRIDVDRIRPQYDSTRHATYTMNTGSQIGGIPINTRRYTTQKTTVDSEPTKQWSILNRNNSLPSRETINHESAKVSNEPYELSNTTSVSTFDGNINDDSISYATIPLDELQQFDLSEGSDNVSDNNQNIIYPWIEVMDPDTEEIFYWNEETEEMRWEL